MAGYGNGRTAVSGVPLAALQERIRVHDEDIRDIQSSLSGIHVKIDQTYNGMATKLEGVEAAIRKKFDEKSQIPWQGWGLAVSVVTVIGALVWWGINTQITTMTSAVVSNTADIREMQHSLVPREEHRHLWAVNAEALVELNKQLAGRVTSAEHIDLKELERSNYDHLQGQIADINRRLGDAYSIHDAITTQGNKLEALDSRVQQLFEKH